MSYEFRTPDFEFLQQFNDQSLLRGSFAIGQSGPLGRLIWIAKRSSGWYCIVRQDSSGNCLVCRDPEQNLWVSRWSEHVRYYGSASHAYQKAALLCSQSSVDTDVWSMGLSVESSVTSIEDIRRFHKLVIQKLRQHNVTYRYRKVFDEIIILMNSAAALTDDNYSTGSPRLTFCLDSSSVGLNTLWPISTAPARKLIRNEQYWWNMVQNHD